MTLKAFTMPKWGIEMSEGMIGEWSIAEGQDFAKGDILGHVQIGKQEGFLKHHDRIAFFRGQIRHRLSVNDDFTFMRLDQTGNCL